MTNDEETPRGFSFSSRTRDRDSSRDPKIPYRKNDVITLGGLMTIAAVAIWYGQQILYAQEAIIKKLDEKIDIKIQQHVIEKPHISQGDLVSAINEGMKIHEERSISRSHPEIKQEFDEIKQLIRRISR